MAKSSYIGNLTNIYLNVNRHIGDEGIIEFTRSSYLRHLSKLGLAQNQITTGCSMSILESGSLNRLTTLDVSWTRLDQYDEAHLTALPQRLFISSISSLDSSDGFADNTFLPMVMRTPLSINLRTLRLRFGN